MLPPFYECQIPVEPVRITAYGQCLSDEDTMLIKTPLYRALPFMQRSLTDVGSILRYRKILWSVLCITQKVPRLKLDEKGSDKDVSFEIVCWGVSVCVSRSLIVIRLGGLTLDMRPLLGLIANCFLLGNLVTIIRNWLKSGIWFRV